MSIIIDHISVERSHVPPGGTTRVFIAAHSTAGQELLLAGPAVDQVTGEQVAMSVTVTRPTRAVNFHPQPPLRGTLVADPNHPGQFIYTAEAAHGR